MPHGEYAVDAERKRGQIIATLAGTQQVGTIRYMPGISHLMSTVNRTGWIIGRRRLWRRL